MRALFLLTLILSTALLTAEETRSVNCRFLAFGGPATVNTVIASGGAGVEINCPLPSVELSKKVVCQAKDNVIQFLSTADKKPVGKAAIPSDMKSALLVFVPATGPEGADPKSPSWRVLVIPDNAKTFPDGGVYVANFYNGDIRFVIGEHKGMLHAAGNHGYAMPTVLDDFNMAPVVFELQQGEKWRVASESRLRFLPETRYLIFAYADAATGRPKISTFRDLTGLEPVASAAR